MGHSPARTGALPGVRTSSKTAKSKGSQPREEDSKVHWVGAHPLYDAPSRRILNPIKVVHDPRQLDGIAHLSASAFNRLGIHKIDANSTFL